MTSEPVHRLSPRPDLSAMDYSRLMDDAALAESIRRARPYTLLDESDLLDLGRQVCGVLTLGVPGDFVECGVWRGGASFLVADLLRRLEVHDRKVWLLDSFEGLPPPAQADGSSAAAALDVWATDPRYTENLRASLEDVQEAAAALGLLPYARFGEGWFDETLPRLRHEIGPIALLRVDADWHDSVLCCLENLYDQVSAGGLVVFDDYYDFEGCALAVHQFLGARKVAHRLENTRNPKRYRLALFRKGDPPWQPTWEAMQYGRTRHEVVRHVASVVREGGTYILVDENQWGVDLVPGRRALPFLERDGQYWGLPPDDATAVAELERMRRAGAESIVFPAPSFWWLEHYAGLRHHLETHYARVLDVPALVGFRL